jgi:poly(3-hydroxybutyrate) depolymerase
MEESQMRRQRYAPSAMVLFVALVAHLVAAQNAAAQARATVASLRTQYNTVRTQAKPAGELKAQFDALEEQIARAARLGRTGEVRRLYSKGIALAGGRAWTPQLEFANSLALRTERLFVDGGSVGLRLEQIYMPSIELAEPLTVRVALHRPGTGARASQVGDKIQDAGAFVGVSRDLIDNPFLFDVDLSAVPDGRAIVRAEAFQGSQSLGAATLTFEVRRGLDRRLQQLETGIRDVKGFEALRAEVLYPVDYIRHVDRGSIPVGQFDYDREVTAAEAVLTSLQGGKDPFAGRTGDFKRHYSFTDAGEVMPYRLYVPTAYKGDRAYPLIVMLHGNGLNENQFMDGNGDLQRLAEERGYIVVAPLGYRVDGGYGYNNGSRSAEEDRKLQLSEKDVLNVLDLMKTFYRIDPARILLAGHSMGGGGTWYMGAKHATLWAGLASFAGAATPETIPPLPRTPQFIVHGDADATVTVERSRSMVAALKKLGVDHQYVEVPGGTHGNVITPNLKGMFDFFDKQRR